MLNGMLLEWCSASRVVAVVGAGHLPGIRCSLSDTVKQMEDAHTHA